MGAGCSSDNAALPSSGLPHTGSDTNGTIENNKPTAKPVFQPLQSPTKKKNRVNIHDRKDWRSRGPSWKEMLKAAAEKDLWDGTVRSERGEWKGLLEQAEDIISRPRRNLHKDTLQWFLEGNMEDQVAHSAPNLRSKVILFVSSTFTDTLAERNQLMKDVYPYLRELCRILGLDFGTVDMRWGVREETTKEHGVTEMCVRQVNRCREASSGPAFLAIIGNKYGYRPVPASIPQKEFDYILSLLTERDEDTRTIRNYYRLDENAEPNVYILKPRDPTQSSDDWWKVSQEILRQFRLVTDDLSKTESEKYIISVTEEEVKHGVLLNGDNPFQSMIVTRDLERVCEDRHKDRHLVDVTDDAVDTSAQHHMDELKDKLRKASLADIRFDFDYTDAEDDCCDAVRDVCDEICRQLANRIMKSYTERLHVEKDPLFEDVMQHRQFLLQKSEVFAGRREVLGQMTDEVFAGKGVEKRILVIHGVSGCGKTAMLAMVAKTMKEVLMPEAVLVLRFLGTTSSSSSASHLLRSTCLQIARVYGQDAASVPEDYNDLIVYFREALTFATSSKPLIVIFDSLDQLSNENFGHNLKWLSLHEMIPPHAHVIVSTIPGDCFQVLKSHLPEKNFMNVPAMSEEEREEAVDMILEGNSRTVTAHQRSLLTNAFKTNPLPLYLRMAADVALKWHSYDNISPDILASDMRGLITVLFEKLEARYGQTLVHHALAYITAAKSGLSETELEDILSCDDDVLDEVFSFWLPPIRRIPPLLWVRIRDDLGMYLMEKGSDDITVYGWYHRQFRQTAEARYLDGGEKPFRKNAHKAIADYFEEKWVNGKPWWPKKKTRAIKSTQPRVEKRMVTPQPLVLSEERAGKDKKYNRRRLRELPFQLLSLGDLERLEQTLCKLEFIEAKFKVGQGYDCRSELLEASLGPSSRLLKAMSKVVGASLPHLIREPSAIYQLVWQQVDDNVTKTTLKGVNLSSLPLTFITEVNDKRVEDPCELTLRGHTSPVRACEFSPDGSVIVSTGEDKSMRIWDAETGAERVTITGLPGPQYHKLEHRLNEGDRPVIWDRTGRHIITGSENGDFQVWNINGAEIKTPHFGGTPPHSKAITGLAISPDNRLLATCSKDRRLRIWSMEDYSEIKTIESPQILRGCVFNRTGERLAVVTIKISGNPPVLPGVQIYSTSDWSLLTSKTTESTHTIYCITASPTTDFYATGTDHCVVELWKDTVPTEKVEFKDSDHHGYVRRVKFNKGGDRLFSCGDDSLVIVWNVDTLRRLATISAHIFRMSWISIRPDSEDRFVTASHDTSLKIWNYQAIETGRVPEVDGMQFNVLEVSPDRQYVITCQGVNSFCRVQLRDKLRAADRVGRTLKQSFTVIEALWTTDMESIVTLDCGHSGSYPADAAKKTKVMVNKFVTPASKADDYKPVQLKVKCPSAIALDEKYIFVGTYTRLVKVFHIGRNTEAFLFHWDGEEAVESLNPQGSQGRVTSVSNQPGGAHLAVSIAREVRIWEIKSPPQQVKILPSFESYVTRVRYSPNGKYLVAVAGATISVFESSTFTRLHVLTGHGDVINDVAFSPLSRYLASASMDETLRIWNVTEKFAMKATFFSTAREVGFLETNKVLLGGSTGPIKTLTFEE